MSFETSEQFSILFVCTGNICRSPLGEYLLKTRLSDSVPSATVSSAGTQAVIGGNVPREISDYATSRNVSIQGHEPKVITAGMIGNADLVLTAERSHRSEVVSLVPRAAAKTFTLKQFARLANEHEAQIASGSLTTPSIESLQDLVLELADFRSIAVPPEFPTYDDIDDPYLRSESAYRSAGIEISQAIDSIASVLEKYSQR